MIKELAEKQFHAAVKDLRWERIHLYLTISAGNHCLSDDLHLYLVNSFHKVECEADVTRVSDYELVAHFNVTNNGQNRCIDNDCFTLMLWDGDEFAHIGFEGTEEQIQSWTKCFRINDIEGAYTITFQLEEVDNYPKFLLYIYETMRKTIDLCAPWEVPKGEGLHRFIAKCKRSKRRILSKGCKVIYYTARLFSTQKGRGKTILFLSEQNDYVTPNMKHVIDRMKERNLDKQYKIKYSLRNKTLDKRASLVSYFRFWKLMATCGTIVIDDHVPAWNWFVLPKDTKVIQIWHAGAGFKGVGYSRWGHQGCPGTFNAHRQNTYCLSGSKTISHFFSEQFGILDEQVIPTGMPRMDSFLNPEYREKKTKELYDTYPQIKEKRIILFAPTYRGRAKKDAHYPYEMLDFEKLYEYCVKDDAVILFKMHPWVKGKVPIEEKYADRFLDLNSYGNINDLFYITDLMITDYSSGMYEFLLMNKPMLLFAFDKVSFATSRGFHRSYDDNIPGKLCETFDELLAAMSAHDYEFEKVEEFRNKYFDNVDTNNTDRVIDWLILDGLPEEYKRAIEEKKKKVMAVYKKSFEKYFEV